MAALATVLLLGTGQRAAQASARSLQRAGFRVLGSAESGRLYGRTRYCSPAASLPPPATPEFEPALRELVERASVDAVLPLTDEHLGALLVRPAASGRAVVVGPTLTGFERLADKVGLLATAAAADVASPASVVVRAGDDVDDVPRLPAYVKVVSSVYSGVPAGRPVRVCERSQCAAAIKRLQAGGSDVLVQEEVEGRHWRFHFVRAADSLTYVAALQLADYPYRVGQSTVLQYCAAPPRLREQSAALLDTAGYQGIGSIQWIERGNEFLVHDVNLRLPAAVAGTISNGLDLPRAAVELALGQEWKRTAPKPRSRYVWFPGELMAIRETLRGEETGRRASAIAASLVVSALSPRRLLVPFDLTDPLPTLAGVVESLRRTTLSAGV